MSNDVGKLIRNRRQELGLTMKEVAQKVGVSEAAVSRWESGDIENMRRDKIASLAEVLRMSPAQIIGLDEPEEGYYYDPEVAQMVEDLRNNAEMRVLLDASRDLRKEDIFELLDIINKLKRGDCNG